MLSHQHACRQQCSECTAAKRSCLRPKRRAPAIAPEAGRQLPLGRRIQSQRAQQRDHVSRCALLAHPSIPPFTPMLCEHQSLPPTGVALFCGLCSILQRCRAQRLPIVSCETHAMYARRVGFAMLREACGAGGSPTKASKLNVNAPVWTGSPSKAPANCFAASAPAVSSRTSGTIQAVSVEVHCLILYCCSAQHMHCFVRAGCKDSSIP